MKILSIILILLPLISFAQSKKGLTEKIINKSLENVKIGIGKDSVTYKRIPFEVQNRMGNNDYVMTPEGCRFCSLHTYLNSIDEEINSLLSKSTIHDQDSYSTIRLNYLLQMSKKLYPEINLEGYNSLIDFFQIVNKHRRQKQNEFVKMEIEKEKENIAINRRMDSIKRQNEIINRAIEDSISDANELAALEKEKQDIIAFRKFCIKKFGLIKGEMIADGKVSLDMTKTMCLYAWGKPSKIDITKLGTDIFETWFYGQFYSRLLRFKNTRLFSILQ